MSSQRVPSRKICHDNRRKFGNVSGIRPSVIENANGIIGIRMILGKKVKVARPRNDRSRLRQLRHAMGIGRAPHCGRGRGRRVVQKQREGLRKQKEKVRKSVII